MNYILIKGIYYVVGHSPDGDSIKFKAVNPDYWHLINSEFRDAFAQNLMGNGARALIERQLQRGGHADDEPHGRRGGVAEANGALVAVPSPGAQTVHVVREQLGWVG